MAMERMIGREVTLTLKNFSAARTGPFAKDTPETYELKGVVMRNPRGHDDRDTFGFAVKFTEVPLRVVHIRHVLAVDGIPMVQPSPKKMQEWKVKSSRGDETYIVKNDTGNWSCTCVANSNFRKICRHIKEKQG